MKMFHVTCFVVDKYIHDVMTMLEKYKARELEVKTVHVPGKVSKDIVVHPKSNKPLITIKTQDVLIRNTTDKAIYTRSELQAFGLKTVQFAGLIRYGYMKKLKDGNYSVHHKESNS